MKYIVTNPGHVMASRAIAGAILVCACIPVVYVLLLAGCGEDVVDAPAGPDTTSHAFQVRTYVIGEPGSILYDVAVVNDTLAYAVGEIFALDSAGKLDISPYGIAIWNGRDWRLKRVEAEYRKGSGGSLIRAYGILAFSASDVWLAYGDVFQWDGKSDSLMIHGIGENGMNQKPILIGEEAVIKIWGSSSSNLYAVGRHGAAAHYNGTSWRRIESGTTAPIQDVWGARDPKTGVETVLCAATNPVWYSDRRIIRLHPDGTSDTIPRNINRGVVSVWFNSMEKILTAGSGVFVQDRPGSWIEQLSLPQYYTNRIRGKTDNDVFAVGAYGLCAHYNGQNWNTWLFSEFRSLTSCDYRGRTCIGVGYTPETRAAAVVFQR